MEMESGEVGIALAHNLIRNGHNSLNTSVLVRLLGLPFPKVNKEFSEKQSLSSRPRIEDHDDHINVEFKTNDKIKSNYINELHSKKCWMSGYLKSMNRIKRKEGVIIVKSRTS